MKELTLEERYQIYIDRFVVSDDDESVNDAFSAKRTMSSFLCRKMANDFLLEDGTSYASKWLDGEGIPRYE